MMYQLFYSSPIGELLMESDGFAVTRVVFVDNPIKSIQKNTSCDVLQHAATQLDEYFLGKRRSFTIPILQHGTRFELPVWNALQNIPYGATRSYADIAHMIGKPTAVRAVASAIARNPTIIFVPCHRVIKSGGMIGEYSFGAWRKAWLIAREYSSCSHGM